MSNDDDVVNNVSFVTTIHLGHHCKRSILILTLCRRVVITVSNNHSIKQNLQLRTYLVCILGGNT